MYGYKQSCQLKSCIYLLQVRRAYKKCSLRFHPDKAVTHCKFAFSLGPQGAALADRHDIETRVRDEANWLFKCISEANGVLSDSHKRHVLDGELEFEERRMFYRNDGTTPPGGSYSFTRPAASASYRPTANPRPAANPRSSANTRWVMVTHSTTMMSVTTVCSICDASIATMCMLFKGHFLPFEKLSNGVSWSVTDTVYGR